MKKLFCFILLLLCFLLKINVKALNYIDVNIDSNNAILYDVTDDLIMYEKNSNERIKIASLTKIMTAIVAIEHIDDLDKYVTITENDYKNVYEENLSVVGFKIGEKVTYRDLLYGLLFKSGADAAYALSGSISKDEKEFVKLMNEKAKELGLTNTFFTNCVGYDEDNYSTVYDTMVFFKYALENSTFEEIIKDDYYTTSDKKIKLQNVVDELQEKSVVNSEYNDYVLGGKSGYTKEAKNCLASFADYNGTRYIVVTALADKYMQITDSMTIYDAVFKNYSRQKILNKEDYLVSIKTDQDKNIDIYSDHNIDVLLPNGVSKDEVTHDYKGINITKKIKENDVLGQVNFEYNGNIIKSIDLVYDSKIKKQANYKKVGIPVSHNNLGKNILLICIGMFSLIFIFALMLFISLVIDVKKNKRRWKF